MTTKNNNKAPNANRRWYDLKVAKRIPELEMEKLVTEISREEAQLKRDRRLEEQLMWNEMYDNYNILQMSLAKYNKEDVESGNVPLDRRGSLHEKLSKSEETRAFFNFKATVLRKVFDQQAPVRPTYKDLYARLDGRRNVNAKSFRKLQLKFENDGNDLKKFSVDRFSQTIPEPPSMTYVTASRAAGKVTPLPSINR